ncbi:hypothetical protein HOD96_00310 [Candidatus Falkowbacteria bacterium]|jgi:tRNA G10  N-methylase Trm11|nr:hypothetical protein [Candidatus Falkowbacteria bacterium]MBT4432854.1 hypothetical protein [Candidatus Falkowbacteria bacterium]
MLYYFILGQNKNLSIVEILNREEIKRLKLDKKAVFLVENVLFLETDLEIDAQNLINCLGGTIKIGKIERKYKDFSEIKTEDIIELIKGKGGKVHFGFSVVGIKSKKFIKNLAINIKKDFRSEKINSRWVEAKELELSSVVVEKNKLLKKGAEIYFFRSENTVYVGKTLAVQDFEGYSKRDYGRPGRDVLSGMIPPKLAQIMINLTGIVNYNTFLDPFCGSGTFLQEAILMGQKNIIGSDISEKAISNSTENLEWLKNNWGIKSLDYELFCLDVKKLSKKIEFESVDGIATEPYLGPTSLIMGRTSKIESLVQELSESYLDSFKELKKVLRKKKKLVIIFPVLKGKDLIHLNILPQIKALGFKIDPFVPNEFSNLIQTTPRGSILYSRPTPNQRVVREIFVFEKK